jgi:hypothetical protein
MDKNRFKTLEAATEEEIKTLVSNALADLLARPVIEEIDAPADAPIQDDEAEALSRAHLDWLNGRLGKEIN